MLGETIYTWEHWKISRWAMYTFCGASPFWRASNKRKENHAIMLFLTLLFAIINLLRLLVHISLWYRSEFLFLDTWIKHDIDNFFSFNSGLSRNSGWFQNKCKLVDVIIFRSIGSYTEAGHHDWRISRLLLLILLKLGDLFYFYQLFILFKLSDFLLSFYFI